MPASFTGRCLDKFEYSNIDGTYVVDSIVYNGEFTTEKDIDASFAYWGDSAYFAKGKSEALINSVVSNKGVFFMQKQVLCNGEKGCLEFKRGPKLKPDFYRVLAMYEGRLCVIQCAQPMVYTSFVDKLAGIGIKDAIYLDMGTWKYSWYRNSDDYPIDIFPKEPNTRFQTNWLVFKRI